MSGLGDKDTLVANAAGSNVMVLVITFYVLRSRDSKA